jgi:hypothetical protein
VTKATGSTPAPRRCRQASGCSACANARRVALEHPAEDDQQWRAKACDRAKRASELAHREHVEATVIREQCRQSGARDGVRLREDDGKIHVGAQFAGDAA